VGVARRLWPLLLLLAACSSSGRREAEWTHPTKDELEVKTDQADCERFFGGNPRSVEECLAAKGWKHNKR
jgi:hypothetical protein